MGSGPTFRTKSMAEYTVNQIDKIVIGALRDCIYQHGPITHEWIASAAKRITTQLRGAIKNKQITEEDEILDLFDSVDGNGKETLQRFGEICR